MDCPRAQESAERRSLDALVGSADRLRVKLSSGHCGSGVYCVLVGVASVVVCSSSRVLAALCRTDVGYEREI